MAGIWALCTACADVPSDALAFDPEPVAQTPRALALVERPLQTTAEVATILERVQRVKDELARVARHRARDAEVREHASQALQEIALARSELVRKCTALRGESVWVERVTQAGQDLIASLESASDTDFDRTYLRASSALDGQLLDLLSDEADPPFQSPESEELSRLRTLLSEQRTRVDQLQQRFVTIR